MAIDKEEDAYMRLVLLHSREHALNSIFFFLARTSSGRSSRTTSRARTRTLPSTRRTMASSRRRWRRSWRSPLSTPTGRGCGCHRELFPRPQRRRSSTSGPIKSGVLLGRHPQVLPPSSSCHARVHRLRRTVGSRCVFC